MAEANLALSVLMLFALVLRPKPHRKAMAPGPSSV